jgi:hypothetical protein
MFQKSRKIPPALFSGIKGDCFVTIILGVHWAYRKLKRNLLLLRGFTGERPRLGGLDNAGSAAGVQHPWTDPWTTRLIAAVPYSTCIAAH